VKTKDFVATASAQADVDQRELVSPKLKISFIIPLIGFILLFGIIAATAVLAFRQASDQVAVKHSLDVQSRLSRILTLLLDAETGQRGYVITGAESFLEPFYSAAPRIEAEIRGLKQRRLTTKTTKRKPPHCFYWTEKNWRSCDRH
jgi:CHASE3 domain sensor protein